MRLTCRKCKSQYEVADSAIPARGRDVQCSSCGHAWFERPKHDAPAAQPAPRRPDQPPATAPDPAGAVAPPVRDAPAGATTTAPAPRPKRELDPAVAEILRAEATREARERRQEAATAFQAQEELPLGPDLSDHDPEEAFPAPEDAPSAAGETKRRAQLPRRDLLPDIEEINSSLRAKSVLRSSANAALTEEEREERARRGRGFRIGFSSVLLVALFALLLYSYADTLAQRMPALTGPLDAYVDQVNAVRLWLDTKMASGANAISGVLQNARE